LGPYTISDPVQTFAWIDVPLDRALVNWDGVTADTTCCPIAAGFRLQYDDGSEVAIGTTGDADGLSHTGWQAAPGDVIGFEEKGGGGLDGFRLIFNTCRGSGTADEPEAAATETSDASSEPAGDADAATVVDTGAADEATVVDTGAAVAAANDMAAKCAEAGWTNCEDFYSDADVERLFNSITSAIEGISFSDADAGVSAAIDAAKLAIEASNAQKAGAK